jgi:hypothetical protein
MTLEDGDRAALLARGQAARDAGDLAAAEQLFGRLAARDPSDAEAHHHLAGVQSRMGRFEAAEASWRRALALAPDAASPALGLALLLLSQGRYEEGFRRFEARHALERVAKPALPFPEWRGEPVAGKRILVWPEQGFGDQIQFARFAPVLKAMGADVTLLCRPQLARLFAGSLGVRVIAAAGAVEFPDPDAWVMCCSLAGRLGATLETLPAAPYLRPVSAWPPLSQGFKVGLATHGNPAFAEDHRRSLSPQAKAVLRDLPVGAVDLDPAVSGAADFADTAGIIDQLDLVVAVDTSVAHLAGAMGKPCWLLLAHEADWRWLRGREDSPWYPSMRLYRQPRPGDWAAVVDRVAADVAALAAARA